MVEQGEGSGGCLRGGGPTESMEKSMENSFANGDMGLKSVENVTSPPHSSLANRVN